MVLGRHVAAAKTSGASWFLGLLMALSVLRLGQRQARETGTATPACRELPYPAPPSLQPMSRALGERRGYSARRNYRGSRHDDASPHKWGCACLGRRKRLAHSPPDKARKRRRLS